MGFFRWLNDLVAAPVHKEPGKKRRKREDEEDRGTGCDRYHLNPVYAISEGILSSLDNRPGSSFPFPGSPKREPESVL